jgi:hypothetical protein
MKIFKFFLLTLMFVSLPIFSAEHCSKFISVREYEVKNSKEVAVIAQKEFVPIIQKITGFIKWDLIEVSKTKLVTVSHLDNEAAAIESADKAKQWSLKALSSQVISPPEVKNGQVIASSCK